MSQCIYSLSSSSEDSDNDLPDISQCSGTSTTQTTTTCDLADQQKSLSTFLRSEHTTMYNKNLEPDVQLLDDDDNDIQDFTVHQTYSSNVNCEENICPNILRDDTASTTSSNKRKLNTKSSKEQRMEEKQRKAKEKAQLKEEKELMKAAEKAYKPGEAIKYMILLVNKYLLETSAGCQILSELQQAEIKYRVIENTVPCSITVLRKDLLSDTDKQENYGIIVLNACDIVSPIYAQVHGMSSNSPQTLSFRCKEWKSQLSVTNVFLIIFGFENYFKNHLTKTKQKFKNAVSGKSVAKNKASNRATTIEEESLNVTRSDVETALVACNFEDKLEYRFVEDSTKVGKLISQMTKSISEAPYKTMKSQSAKFSWCTEDNKNKMIKIDKNGVGLLKLWHQQLRQFPNVGVEVSQAIIAEYDSPRKLYETYCKLNTKEGEMLLAGISVRRGNGPLVSSRKIGPELSKKIYKFFISRDSDLIL